MPQSEVDILLARRLVLERQRSLPSPYSPWPGRDSASMISKTEIVPESTILCSGTDIPGQPSHSQNTDLMSVLQGPSDWTSSGVNSNFPGWPNFNVQGGSDLLQSKIELHHDQGFPQPPVGFQQRLQPQNQSSFQSPFSQVVDNMQGISTPETLLSTGLPRDPQLLNLLQQKYLLQLHSQASIPAQHISLLDKLLLLKQQQKQEEQQMFLRKQQQLLSQVLSDQQNRQHFLESSFGQLPVSEIPKGNTAVNPRLPTQVRFPIVSNIPVSVMQNEVATQNIQEIHYSASSEEFSLDTPHQMCENIAPRKTWDGTLAEQQVDVRQKESLPASSLVESSSLHELKNKFTEPSVPKTIMVTDYLVTRTLEQPPQNQFRAEPNVDSSQPEIFGDHISVTQPVACESEVPMPEHANNIKVQSNDAIKKQNAGERGSINELPTFTNVKNSEVREPKKASEKKSRKQKSSRAHSEQAKGGVSKTPSSEKMQQSESENSAVGDGKLHTETGAGAVDGTSLQRAVDDKYNKSNIADGEVMGSQQVQRSVLCGSISGDDLIPPEALNSVTSQNIQPHTVQRAWKQAHGFKPKSLLEIQEEEQRRAQTEKLAPETTPSVATLNTPWAGVVGNAGPKVPREAPKDAWNSELIAAKHESSLTQKNKKSHLHDLLAEEVLAKSSENGVEVLDSTLHMTFTQVLSTLSESVDDNNFIEAKDTKKSRKRSAKLKGTGAKISVPPVAIVDASINSSSAEKMKTSRQENEVLPAIPSGPSLGDFVLWKGEPTNPSPLPVWFTDSGKLSKPTSLRDILKEQEKKASSSQHVAQLPIPVKSQPIQACNSGPSWSLSSSFSSKTASPIQINYLASQSRHKDDDDLFWGPIDQVKKENKKYDVFSIISSLRFCLLSAKHLFLDVCPMLVDELLWFGL